jgi:transcriptional regulator with XRE-family HTH domain
MAPGRRSAHDRVTMTPDASRHRLIRRQVSVEILPQGISELFRHARGLDPAAKEPADRHVRDMSRTCEVDRQPALGRHVPLDQDQVESCTLLHTQESLDAQSLRCQELFLTTPHNARTREVRLSNVAKTRSRLPVLKAFGGYLRALRGSRSREQIATRLRDMGVQFDESTLVQYEKGTVWSPDVGVLWGLSQIYSVPLGQLVLILRENRSNSEADPIDWQQWLRAAGITLDVVNISETGESKSYDLLRPTRDQLSRLSSPGDSASATESSSRRDRVSELESELRMLRTQYRDVRDAARAALKQLGKVAAHLGESPAAAAGEAKRGRHDRRTAR